MGSIWSDGTSIDAVDRNVEGIWRQWLRNTTPDYGEVGSDFNGWRNPVSNFARNEVTLAERLRENVYIGEYDISDELWWKSCGVVDEITRYFHVILKKVTSRCYPGLSFRDFVKQGSSREGLKIRQPDEFDMILPFTIEGVDIHAVQAIDKNGELIPAHMKLQISDYTQIQNVMNGCRYQSLKTNGVFDNCGAYLYLNAMCFQTRVISSIMDTTIAEIQKEINAKNRYQACSFILSKTGVFPPTFRFKIKIENDADFEGPLWNATYKVIEFDIVPGLLLQTDSVPNPDSWWLPMTCDRYAVMKWIHKGRCADDYPEPNLLWRESSCGYEKHILDVSRRNQSDVYILTACRILKAYLDGLGNSSQLCSLLSSYHIKNIAIHCILLQLHASGVKEALGYLIVFLEIGLEMEFLPHYFYGNSYISKMFPKLSANANQRRLNLFRIIPNDHFAQAILSLRRMKADLHGLFTECSHLGNCQSFGSFRNLCTLYDEETSGRCLLM
ncbi:uncharacterized protein LOC110453175 [Mizuhopecten yessoensis]|uniref:Mab-21-like nucleotidyltransferase domain-containing protein n=1 Tax=Mizuhopecten yessoensis TaxID=6573 RepID=A0A210QHW4_MIZYE|nr:uncharacterized protein LOC110453175 [Mizuhopecten yessoensis]OWF48378.1 hypothetical protein KP79_PYT18728 [Mizuhopecten yessoensis]